MWSSFKRCRIHPVEGVFIEMNHEGVSGGRVTLNVLFASGFALRVHTNICCPIYIRGPDRPYPHIHSGQLCIRACPVYNIYCRVVGSEQFCLNFVSIIY
jgi:hypothetical protein